MAKVDFRRAISLVILDSVVCIGVLTLEHEKSLSRDWYREFI